MRNQILEHITNPEALEQLYRSDKAAFRTSFSEVYPDIEDALLAKYWQIRLSSSTTKSEKNAITRADLITLILCCLSAGVLMKLPVILGLENESFFYSRNIALIVFASLSAFVFWTQGTYTTKQITLTAGVFLLSALYINFLPDVEKSDTIILACMHLPLFLWCVYGLVRMAFDKANFSKRIAYLRYNGDLAILMAIIAISGMLLSAITIGLFSAIDIHIDKFYGEYVVVFGLVSMPIVATYIIRIFPNLTNRIAAIIANIFCPLVLIMLTIYLISMPIAGKDPYLDRDFLIIFNMLLIGVMAIIVFAISEIDNFIQRVSKWTLLLLSILTLIVDLIALSAILYRLAEFGFTPNRTVVLGSNLLVLGHLILITNVLFQVCFRGVVIQEVESTIARYLPLYSLWTIFVTFLLPLIFRFA